MSEIKLQDQVHVATLRRQDSDANISWDGSNPNSNRESANSTPLERSSSGVFDNIIARPERPKLNLRLSNAEFTNIHNVHMTIADDSDILPDQVVPEKNIMTSRNPPKNMIRIIAIFIWEITCGFSDATPGAILPYMEESYGLTYTTVSLIWMSNAAGFIFIACVSHKLQAWFGKSKILSFGTCCSIIMYAIVLSGTLFPVIVVAFFVGGMGLATDLAQANVFLARLDKLSKYLSFCHASYGVGATISPLIATAFISAGIPWHYFYLLLLGMMLFNTALFYYAFRGADEDLAYWDHHHEEEFLRSQSPIEENPVEENGIGLADLDENGIPQPVAKPEPKQIKKGDHAELIAATKSSTTWLIAFFVLFYQGSEVSLAGWIVTFLLDYRGGPTSSGYVASGFWGGLTLGRLLLTRPLHTRFGVRRSVLVVSIISIVLVALVWIIPNVLAAGIIVSIAGIFIGPNFPLMIALSTDLLPRKIQVVALTIVTAFGSSGGALFPFIIGIMSQHIGPYVVLPAFIVLYFLMIVIWICLPNKERMMKGQNDLTMWQKLW